MLALSFFAFWNFSGTGQPSYMVRQMAFRDTVVLRRSILFVAVFFTLIYLPLILIFTSARILLPGMEVSPDRIMPELASVVTTNAGMPCWRASWWPLPLPRSCRAWTASCSWSPRGWCETSTSKTSSVRSPKRRSRGSATGPPSAWSAGGLGRAQAAGIPARPDRVRLGRAGGLFPGSGGVRALLAANDGRRRGGRDDQRRTDHVAVLCHSLDRHRPVQRL